MIVLAWLRGLRQDRGALIGELGRRRKRPGCSTVRVLWPPFDWAHEADL